MKREKNLLAAIELAITTLKEDLTPKKRQDAIRLLRQAIHSWKKKRDSDQDDFGILNILSIHRSVLPESLVTKLFDPNQMPELWSYTDNLNNSDEHLFSISLINETAEYNLELTPKEQTAFASLKKRMDEDDCSYFRFIQ